MYSIFVFVYTITGYSLTFLGLIYVFGLAYILYHTITKRYCIFYVMILFIFLYYSLYYYILSLLLYCP